MFSYPELVARSLTVASWSTKIWFSLKLTLQVIFLKGFFNTKYSGLPGGPEWLPGYDRPIKYYVPSIAASACLIYNGDEFKEWNGEALIASLKHQSLRRLKFKDNEFLNEEVIFKNNIGRIRDVKQQKDGKILMLSDNGELWRMSKK